MWDAYLHVYWLYKVCTGSAGTVAGVPVCEEISQCAHTQGTGLRHFDGESESVLARGCTANDCEAPTCTCFARSGSRPRVLAHSTACTILHRDAQP